MADPRAEQKGEDAIATAAALVTVYGAAKANVLARVANGVRSGLLLPYWADRITAVNEKALKRIAAKVAKSISSRVSVSRMDRYLEDAARGRATGWMENTDALLSQIDKRAEDFERQIQIEMDKTLTQAPEDAQDISDAATEFGSIEAEKANGATTKTWHLGAGSDHRASHVALNGVTIPIGDTFANGLRYPHAPGPPAETVNCDCYLTFGG